MKNRADIETRKHLNYMIYMYKGLKLRRCSSGKYLSCRHGTIFATMLLRLPWSKAKKLLERTDVNRWRVEPTKQEGSEGPQSLKIPKHGSVRVQTS